MDRRDFLRASLAIAAAFGLPGCGDDGGFDPPPGHDARPITDPRVVWLEAQGCSGCSVSLLNSIYFSTIDTLLTNSLSLRFHPTLMAASGATAVAAAEAERAAGGHILVVEGAIPTAAGGRFCRLWEETTAADALRAFADRATFILAVGTCASSGGIPAAAGQVTGSISVGEALGSTDRLVNLPGCPTHPDWIVGTVAHLLRFGKPPALDAHLRPREFYGTRVHERCPLRGEDEATALGEPGCLRKLGCRGPQTFADCPVRQWNSPAPGTPGASWCVASRGGCQGCTEPDFPDGKSPFYRDPREDA